jgi:hypothetical protein
MAVFLVACGIFLARFFLLMGVEQASRADGAANSRCGFCGRGVCLSRFVCQHMRCRGSQNLVFEPQALAQHPHTHGADLLIAGPAWLQVRVYV